MSLIPSSQPPTRLPIAGHRSVPADVSQSPTGGLGRTRAEDGVGAGAIAPPPRPWCIRAEEGAAALAPPPRTGYPRAYYGRPHAPSSRGRAEHARRSMPCLPSWCPAPVAPSAWFARQPAAPEARRSASPSGSAGLPSLSSPVRAPSRRRQAASSPAFRGVVDAMLRHRQIPVHTTIFSS
ncbi:uncharacterized protein LOC123404446 isoform X2 [Hordeum vulgare subsp. vulgare]|uniref:uncharacterized protein LOC123404446 isoform X2 n=1 Tax=Hordeum vulgare subsp. vulgare TaxID=112509 RepID=UPI001D1A54C9|nr:uncharacterized protein LOC123404446 isoform X2 [Hordeum vulgare subsp. vulgare]